MGGGGSKEVRVPANPAASEKAVAEVQGKLAIAENKAQGVATVEQKLFQEGYIRGREDALKSLKEEIERETKSAYAQQVLEDEKARSAAVAAEAEKLSKKFPKPPMRPQECKAEEDALLACTPSSANRGCAEQIHSYKQCADTVLFRLMNPALR